jgi:hypothetical protein
MANDAPKEKSPAMMASATHVSKTLSQKSPSEALSAVK